MDTKISSIGVALLFLFVSIVSSQDLTDDEDNAPLYAPRQNPVSQLPYQGPPFAYPCIAPRVACINYYSAVIPDGFGRVGAFSSYLGSTRGQNTGFAPAVNASFLVFDPRCGAEILGSNPEFEFMFSLPLYIHEAPVHVPEYDRYVSIL